MSVDRDRRTDVKKKKNPKTYHFCSVLAGHSALHVLPHNQSLSVSGDVSSSSSSCVSSCTWYQNSGRNVLQV